MTVVSLFADGNQTFPSFTPVIPRHSLSRPAGGDLLTTCNYHPRQHASN